MFWNRAKEILRNERNIEILRHEIGIAKLKNQKEELEKSITALRADQKDEFLATTEIAEHSFDFRGMRAFSIERVVKNGYPATVIGYLDNANNSSKLWYLYTSMKRHNQLVMEFNEYLRNKYDS